jgi:hypothetical protein
MNVDDDDNNNDDDDDGKKKKKRRQHADAHADELVDVDDDDATVVGRGEDEDGSQ